MGFGREKYSTMIMKSGKRETAEEIGPQNQESIRVLEKKENYLGILEADTIKKK